jgi:hypothetical protein
VVEAGRVEAIYVIDNRKVVDSSMRGIPFIQLILGMLSRFVTVGYAARPMGGLSLAVGETEAIRLLDSRMKDYYDIALLSRLYSF